MPVAVDSKTGVPALILHRDCTFGTTLDGSPGSRPNSPTPICLGAAFSSTLPKYLPCTPLGCHLNVSSGGGDNLPLTGFWKSIPINSDLILASSIPCSL